MALALILGMYDWKETSQGKVEQTADAIQALQVSVTMIPAAVLMLAILGLLFIYRPASFLSSRD
jgi:GPH family glycoside/pentoside/hexuronide:cation symporter